MRDRGFGVSPADRLLIQLYALVKTSSITLLKREQTNKLYPVWFSLFETIDKNDLDVISTLNVTPLFVRGDRKIRR